MQRIRVLQVIPDLGLAGAEIMCENLSCSLHATSMYEVTVCSLFRRRTAITDRIERSGVKVIYLDKNRGLDTGLVHRLYRLMKSLNPDIVHTHRYAIQYVMPAAILAGIPVRIHTVHNIATKEMSRSRRLLCKVLYRHFHVLPVSISPLVTQTIETEYGMANDRIPMVFNGIDLGSCPVKDGYACGKVFRFVHIGRMEYQKNHVLIMEVAKRMKEEGRSFVINLIGDGERRLHLQTLAGELGLDDVVRFCGLKSDVYPSLHDADCFLLPSLYEGMPVTLIEAMGCGLPIIASAVGGVPNMIDNGDSGILIQPTAEELYAAMCQMMDSTPLYRERLGTNAKKKSEQFSVQNMRAGYDAVYQDEMKKWKERREMK